MMSWFKLEIKQSLVIITDLDVEWQDSESDWHARQVFIVSLDTEQRLLDIIDATPELGRHWQPHKSIKTGKIPHWHESLLKALTNIWASDLLLGVCVSAFEQLMKVWESCY